MSAKGQGGALVATTTGRGLVRARILLRPGATRFQQVALRSLSRQSPRSTGPKATRSPCRCQCPEGSTRKGSPAGSLLTTARALPPQPQITGHCAPCPPWRPPPVGVWLAQQPQPPLYYDGRDWRSRRRTGRHRGSHRLYRECREPGSDVSASDNTQSTYATDRSPALLQGPMHR